MPYSFARCQDKHIGAAHGSEICHRLGYLFLPVVSRNALDTLFFALPMFCSISYETSHTCCSEVMVVMLLLCLDGCHGMYWDLLSCCKLVHSPRGVTVDRGIEILFRVSRSLPVSESGEIFVALLKRDARRERDGCLRPYRCLPLRNSAGFDTYIFYAKIFSRILIFSNLCVADIRWKYVFTEQKELYCDVCIACVAGVLLGSGVRAALLFRLRGGKPRDFCGKYR